MKELLDACPYRVVVLDPSTAAVCLKKEGLLEQGRKPGEQVFGLVAEWLKTGVFPRSKRLGRRFVDISK